MFVPLVRLVAVSAKLTAGLGSVASPDFFDGGKDEEVSDELVIAAAPILAYLISLAGAVLVLWTGSLICFLAL